MKSLDRKLAAIRARSDGREFILADAKDPDMAFGVRAIGPRDLPRFLDDIRAIVAQGIVDIMLMSASVNQRLTIDEGLFEDSSVTPAARANDATDIWAVRHGRYVGEPSRPFRSATIDGIRCGASDCPEGPVPGADLGLYSITFVNDPECDRESLAAFAAFRREAERKGFRYFLEVFNPNVPAGVATDRLGEFINDSIIRSLAGVTGDARPLFLKIAWNGPRAMEELAGYDPDLVVGIMGGSAGTSHDAFLLVREARRCGARAALYGRKILHAEHQPAFIEMLRHVVEERISPLEAVHAYHGVLDGLGIRSRRTLEEDSRLTDPWLRSDRTGPDFRSMTAGERLRYHRDRLGRRFG